MKTITLIRHAHAESGLNKLDLHRQLSKRGQQEAEEQSAGIVLPNDAMLMMSHSTRTQETAAHWLQKQPHLRHSIVAELYNADLNTLLGLIEENTHEKHVVIIGHNPGISELFHFLSGQWIAFEPCTVAVLQRDINAESLDKGKATILAFQIPVNNE